MIARPFRAQHRDMSEIVIRPAVLPDLGTLVELIRQYFHHDRIEFSEDAVRGGLKILLADQTIGQAWLVEQGTRTIGYAIASFGFDLEFGGRQATLTDIFIEESHRKSGLGKRVLGAVEDYCRRCGVRALELQAERQNTVALAFYQRQGFRPHDRLPMSKRL